MAAINNEIRLTDRMSPVFRSIMKAMDSTMKVMEQLDKQTRRTGKSKAFRQMEKDVDEANKAILDLVGAESQAEKGAENIGRAMDGNNAAITRMHGNMGRFITDLYHTIRLVERIGEAIGDMLDLTDQARSAVARIGLFNTSDKSNEELYNAVYQVAQMTRSDLGETSDLVNKVLISGVFGEDERAPEAAIGLSNIINKALVAGGGTAEENARALLQLNQALASGVLQGDELRSIREQAPYLAKILAEGLGKIDDKFIGTTIGDLKTLGAEGELTSDRIVKAFVAMSDEIDAAFGKMPKTFGQATTTMKNTWNYFLYILSQTGGALDLLNQKIWEFVDFLSTEQGIEVLNGIASAFNALVYIAIWAVEAIGGAFAALQENANLLQAVFIGVGVVAVAAGIAAFVAWVAASWPILLVLAAVIGLIYVFLEMGYTASEVIGAIAGGFMFLLAVIWDVILFVAEAVAWVAMAIWNVVFTLLNIILIVLQAIVQGVLWVGEAIYTIVYGVFVILGTIVRGALVVVSGFVEGVYGLFVGLGEGVLSVLYAIASAIDWVFGSNLAGTVQGWMNGLAGSFDSLVATLDVEGQVDDIGGLWSDFVGNTADLFGSNDLNIYDKIGDTAGRIGDVFNGTSDWAFNGDDFMAVDGFLGGMLQNPMDAWDSGYSWGEGVGNALEGFDFGGIQDALGGSYNLDDIMGALDGVNIAGGDLDSVGKIKGDVNLNDEDIQLLRDMAARDYLLNLQQITPVAHISFGDVRETADVNKIMDVIEDMVEEQMATALVG